MGWAEPAVNRDQLVLFSTKLDDIIEHDHIVRIVDLLLNRLDWRPMESSYHGRIGQPPIHPRILCAVILYGLICRIRASRQLEEALRVRVDFRWLAHGMSIDHTTLSEFRRKHPEQLRQAKQNLQEEFDRLNKKADQEEAQDEEAFGGSCCKDDSSKNSSGELPSGELPSGELPSGELPSGELTDEQRLKQVQQRQKQIDAALAELQQIENSDEKTPSRLPITDPESRLSKTKEGGFAPSYTPTATVDIDSGMIIDENVIANSNESGELMSTIDQVRQDYHLDGPVEQVLADGLMSTGENLQACEELGVDLYSPVSGAHQGDNPARREKLSEPVPADQLDRLPMKNVRIAGQKEQRFDKQAFVYDAEQNVYWCPAGQVLKHSSGYQTTSAGKQITRDRYRADRESCAGCPLASRCLSGQAKSRQIDRGEYDDSIERQIAKMNQAESSKIYSARRHAGERPFAVIKQVFGARQFLRRGLASVQQEWRWLSLAFDLCQLAGYIRRGVVPP